jgi:hypothetical protein
MSNTYNNTMETLEDSVLIEMAFGRPEVGSDTYDDFLIEKLSLEKIKSEIDRTSGAPSNVRFSVGAAQSPEDKLATLQVFYPDAMRVEDLDPEKGAMEFGYGNFVFTNPETQKLTLYDEFNPKFLGIPVPTGRDFLDVGPEVAETVGAIGGLIGGGIAGAGAGSVALPIGGTISGGVAGAVAGEGLGSATARELYIGIADVFGETVDTRNLGERAVDFTQTATFNAAAGPFLSKTWQGIKYVGGQPIKYMTGGVSPNAKQTREAFDTVGVTNPTAGQISTNPTLNMLESGLANMPPSTKIMHQNAAQTVTEIDAFAKELAKKYGGVRTTDEAGLALMSGARAARQRYTNTVDSLYNKVNIGMNQNISSQANHTREFVEKYIAAAETQTGQNTLKPVMEMAAKVLADADAGVLNYNNLKNFRTFLREDLSSATAAGAKLNASERKMKELYGYISKDLADLVEEAGNDVSRLAFKEANEFVAKMQADTIGSITYLDNVIAKGEVEANKALKYVLTGAKDGGESLAKLKSIMDPDEYNVISGYMLGTMGLPTPGMSGAAGLGEELVVQQGSEYIATKGFSPRRFMTKWEGISKEAKDALFRGTEYEDLIPELDALVFTVKKIGTAAEQMANPSGSARNLSTAVFFSGIGGGAYAGFDFGIGALAAPYLSAQLLTNKNFVRWLTEGIEKTAYDPNSYGQHVRRLYQIYELNPEIRPHIRALLEGMQFETIEEIEDRNAANVPPVTTAVPNEQAFREVTNPEIAGKLLPDIQLAEQVVAFEAPQVSDPAVIMSPTVLPDEADREIAMRQQAGGIGSLG